MFNLFKKSKSKVWQIVAIKDELKEIKKLIKAHEQVLKDLDVRTSLIYNSLSNEEKRTRRPKKVAIKEVNIVKPVEVKEEPIFPLKEKPIRKCLRCDFTWQGKILTRPSICPKCKSRAWDKETVRTYKRKAK